MSDLQSAAIFRDIFRILRDELPLADAKRLAAAFWPRQQNLDFAPEDLHADDLLVELGLAIRQADPETGEFRVLYATPGLDDFT